jgi:hypothetical protein
MSNTAEVVVFESQLFAVGGDEYAVVLDAALPVHIGNKIGPYYLSVQPNGAFESRSEIGAWEKGKRVDDLLAFPHSGPLNRALRVVKL